MASPELATAVQHDLAVVAIVADNGMFGTIRMHQERSFPGRVEGTDLVNPDFAALARACGWHAVRAERDADVEGALREALGAGRPALVHLRCDPDAITPQTTLHAIAEGG
jgi:acetolactate synthase-1/2/3 large subunit